MFNLLAYIFNLINQFPRSQNFQFKSYPNNSVTNIINLPRITSLLDLKRLSVHFNLYPHRFQVLLLNLMELQQPHIHRINYLWPYSNFIQFQRLYYILELFPKLLFIRRLCIVIMKTNQGLKSNLDHPMVWEDQTLLVPLHRQFRLNYK